MTTETIPTTQHAVQLTGAERLELNSEKPVPKPGPHQILARVEAVGLCFSDLKLLKQFDQHARKGAIVGGVDDSVLTEHPSYVPGDKPTVPGHEVACRIVAVGDKVQHHKVGERCLVQTDYRDLPTAGSNAAFGYNFEGGLQEYVLLDERLIIDRRGERFLIPVGEQSSASAVALVEPWACVEDSYVVQHRRGLTPGGRLLVVADSDHEVKGLDHCISAQAMPGAVTAMVATPAQREPVATLGPALTDAESITALPDEGFDDIIYFGSDAATIEQLNDKLATRGMINIVLGSGRIGRPVNIGIGRIHYGLTRWVGTKGEDAAESYRHIPESGEIRKGDRILVVGAGGPMGQMHVIRNICSGLSGIEVVGTDFDDARLESLRIKAEPLARANNVKLQLLNTAKQAPEGEFNYIALMAPVPDLVAQAIGQSATDAIINIFAGIPAPVKHEIDLERCIANRCFMFGTSGSVIDDMKIVLRKLEAGQLDTNTSIDAISGMAGAADGIKAVEERTLAGKIVVYPMLHDLGLTPLSDLPHRFPTVAAKLHNGQWTREAEQELLKAATEEATG